MSCADYGPPISDAEARANWHHEMQPQQLHSPSPDDDVDDDDYDGEYLGHVQCWACSGEGTVIDCCDDLCHGQDWCMHGDNRPCPECRGEGWA